MLNQNFANKADGTKPLMAGPGRIIKPPVETITGQTFMTEDDTFRILSRISLWELMTRRNELFSELSGGDCSYDERNRRIEDMTIELGWTEKEYYKALGPPYDTYDIAKD